MTEETLPSACLLSVSSPSSNASTFSSSLSSPSLPLTPTTTSSSSFPTQPPVSRSSSSGFLTSSNLVDAVPPSSRSCYLTARAQINNIPGIVLLDTGSGVTIISSRHWSVLGSPDSVRPYHGPAIHGPDDSSIQAF